MRSALLTLVLAGCAAKPPAAPPPPPAPPTLSSDITPGALVLPEVSGREWLQSEYWAWRSPAEALVGVRAAPVRAVVRVLVMLEECSGLGGTHVYFEVVASDPAQPGVAHVGGHGVYLGPRGDEPPAFAPGAWFVAGLEPLASPKPPPSAGWCIDDAPAVSASVQAIAPVPSREAGAALLGL